MRLIMHIRCQKPAPMISAAGPVLRGQAATGPSRTGDIEQTIMLGAHGPRRLHIVIVDDD